MLSIDVIEDATALEMMHLGSLYHHDVKDAPDKMPCGTQCARSLARLHQRCEFAGSLCGECAGEETPVRRGEAVTALDVSLLVRPYGSKCRLLGEGLVRDRSGSHPEPAGGSNQRRNGIPIFAAEKGLPVKLVTERRKNERVP